LTPETKLEIRNSKFAKRIPSLVNRQSTIVN